MELGSGIYWTVEIIFLLSICVRLFIRRSTIAEEARIFMFNIGFRYLGIFGLTLLPMFATSIFSSGVLFDFFNHLGESLALTLVKALIDLFVLSGILIIWSFIESIIRRLFIKRIDSHSSHDQDDYFDGVYS